MIDGAVVTEPPLERMPSADELMRIYATWQQGTR
jgi:acyl-CoA-binding protein